MSTHGPMPRSAWIFPALAILLFAVATLFGISFTPSTAGLVFAAVLLVFLFGTVFAAVHHAELIAERIGEPYGTLLLTLAVTVIEVALIATIMAGEKPAPTLARDTVFAVVMIVCDARGGGSAGQAVFPCGRRRRRRDRRAAGVCGHCGGAVDPAAGESCRDRRRAQKRAAEEHQSGAGVFARHHRIDDSRRRGRRLCA